MVNEEAIPIEKEPASTDNKAVVSTLDSSTPSSGAMANINLGLDYEKFYHESGALDIEALMAYAEKEAAELGQEGLRAKYPWMSMSLCLIISLLQASQTAD